MPLTLSAPHPALSLPPPCTFLTPSSPPTTGDSEPEPGELDAADIICTTPEKFDGVTRRLNERGGATFFSEVRQTGVLPFDGNSAD